MAKFLSLLKSVGLHLYTFLINHDLSVVFTTNKSLWGFLRNVLFAGVLFSFSAMLVTLVLRHLLHVTPDVVHMALIGLMFSLAWRVNIFPTATPTTGAGCCVING